jgi:hypothetical protein
MGICASARFAGVIGEQGGKFVLTPAPGFPRFEGGFQNGVNVRSWRDYPCCYTVSAFVSQVANDLKPAWNRIDKQAIVKTEEYF